MSRDDIIYSQFLYISCSSFFSKQTLQSPAKQHIMSFLHNVTLTAKQHVSSIYKMQVRKGETEMIELGEMDVKTNGKRF